MILAIRTDKPEAEIYLYKPQGEMAESLKWLADRNLSKEIHKKIDLIFSNASIDYPNLSGVIFYKGPGSFTGLRIGASVANVISNHLDIPIVGCGGDGWIRNGLHSLRNESSERTALPDYGSEPHTTKPKK